MPRSPIPVILDTDIGTDIDDTWALAMLLRCPELDLKLVVTGVGDPTYRARIAARLLEVAGRTDVAVGVGVHQGPSPEFQAPWVADYDLDDYPGRVYLDGVQAMIDVIMTSPQPVTLIAIGPLPNLARALEIEPRIAPRCRLVMMSGSFDRGYGGPPAVAETNVRVDVPAARAVYAAPWQSIVITPLDTCDLAILDGALYQRVLQSGNPLVQAVIQNYRIWAGLVTWTTVDFADRRSSTLFDTVAVYLAYAHDWLHMEPVRLAITGDGRTVRDPAGREVLAAMRWRDLDAYLAHLVARLLGEG
jgi:inosine-uridine nucleoside N-ribohydrolase